MTGAIEDYGLIGDLHTAALVGRDGSIDWLCLPRFDSPACFAALLGTRDHGRWLIAPAGEIKAVRRRYIEDTLVLQTEFETRFDYGSRVPWVRKVDGSLLAVAGPDALRLTTPVEMRGEDLRHVASF